jgi:hypothetical protein
VDLYSFPSSHAESPPLSFGHVLSDPLHFSNKISVAFIASDANAKQALAASHLEYDELKMSGCLNEHLAADVHPLDVRNPDLALSVTRLKYQPIIRDHQPAVTVQVQDERDKRDDDKEYHDIHERIPENELELILKEASLDSGVQQKYEQVRKCLLIVEIEFVFECLLLHSELSNHPQDRRCDLPSCLRLSKLGAESAHVLQALPVIQECKSVRFEGTVCIAVSDHHHCAGFRKRPGIMRLVVAGCMGIWDYDCRFPHSCQFCERRCASAAQHQIRRTKCIFHLINERS